MPLTPLTLTRIDPALPLLWRDGSTLQIGVDQGVRVDAEAGWVEPLLSRMCGGFRRSSFDVLAHAAGAPRGEARALLRRLEPVLRDDPPPAQPAWIEGIGIRDGRAEARLRDVLDDEGVRVVDRDHANAVGIILVRGTTAAVLLAPYLRDDIAHLPIAVEHGRLTVGPLVVPGETPCLSCRDAGDVRRDPAWPLLHAQLIGRGPERIRAGVVAEAGVLAAALLRRAPRGDGREVRVRPDGSHAWRTVTFHEECRCRAPWSRSLPGNGTEPALRDPRSATRTGTAFARPA